MSIQSAMIGRDLKVRPAQFSAVETFTDLWHSEPLPADKPSSLRRLIATGLSRHDRGLQFHRRRFRSRARQIPQGWHRGQEATDHEEGWIPWVRRYQDCSFMSSSASPDITILTLPCLVSLTGCHRILRYKARTTTRDPRRQEARH